MLRSVPTYDLAQPGQLEEALDVFDTLVLKPRAGHGGVGVLIAPRASREEIEATRAAVIADPGAWIAQRMVMLSTHPTVVEGGRLAPRHIDLRPFVFLGEGCNPRVLPGRVDARGALRGRAGRELVPERRSEGHLGPALRRAARVRRVQRGAPRRRVPRAGCPPLAVRRTRPSASADGALALTGALPWRRSAGVTRINASTRTQSRGRSARAEPVNGAPTEGTPAPAGPHCGIKQTAARRVKRAHSPARDRRRSGRALRDRRGLLAVHAARSQRPPKPRRIRPRRSSSPRPESASRACSGVVASSPSVPAPSSTASSRRCERRGEVVGAARFGRGEHAAGGAREQVEGVGGVAEQRRAGLDQRVRAAGEAARDRAGHGADRAADLGRRSRPWSASRTSPWPGRRRSPPPGAAMIRLRATKHQRYALAPGGISETTAPRAATAACSRCPRAGYGDVGARGEHADRPARRFERAGVGGRVDPEREARDDRHARRRQAAADARGPRRARTTTRGGRRRRPRRPGRPAPWDRRARAAPRAGRRGRAGAPGTPRGSGRRSPAGPPTARSRAAGASKPA